MGIEIERKYLVTGDGWRTGDARQITQGYLCTGPPVAVRVRITDDEAHLNVKQSTTAITRAEFEYPIPVEDARALLKVCAGQIVEKTRHYLEHGGLTWEIDEFHGANEGLLVAEVELDSESAVPQMPGWAGEEVSGDPRYLNSNLAQHPYSTWQ